MFKKKYRCLMAAFVFAAAAIVGGCGEKVVNDKEENTEEIQQQKDSLNDAQADMTDEKSGLVFTTQDIYGETVTEEVFSDYELTLVNIFATWCSPCIVEMPELAQLDKNMEEKGVNVVAVCIDALDQRGELDLNALALAQQIAEMSEADFQFLVPDETLFGGRLANVQAVPESFFVDSEGRIVGEAYVGARDLETWTQVVNAELSNLK